MYFLLEGNYTFHALCMYFAETFQKMMLIEKL